MNCLKSVCEVIDISSSEDEEGILERSSTPLPREFILNYRVVLEEATADEEECFDVSTDSLESNCKKMRLNCSLESLESAAHALRQNPTERQNEGLPDRPESPDESMCSDIFIIEESPDNEESMTSSRVAEYLEKVQQEDSTSYFDTPPGTPRKIIFKPASPLDDLEKERDSSITEASTEAPPLTLMPRLTGRGVFPRRVALSQPTPGLGCQCKRVGIGRGHGCSSRFPRWYFGF